MAAAVSMGTGGMKTGDEFSVFRLVRSGLLAASLSDHENNLGNVA